MASHRRGLGRGLVPGYSLISWAGPVPEEYVEQAAVRIVTWNGRDNSHMIAVNETMGYTVFGPPSTWFRLDVAAVPGFPG